LCTDTFACARTVDQVWRAAQREVAEETGVRTRFQSILALHESLIAGHTFGKNSLFFLVALQPLAPYTLTRQPTEIAAVRWMPLREYFDVPSWRQTPLSAALASTKARRGGGEDEKEGSVGQQDVQEHPPLSSLLLSSSSSSSSSSCSSSSSLSSSSLSSHTASPSSPPSTSSYETSPPSPSSVYQVFNALIARSCGITLPSDHSASTSRLSPPPMTASSTTSSLSSHVDAPAANHGPYFTHHHRHDGLYAAFPSLSFTPNKIVE
jgi:hypothetical protein